MEQKQRRENHEYELVWKTGHVETIWACQVSWPNNSKKYMGSMFDGMDDHDAEDIPNIIHFHADLGGKWTFVMMANEDELLSIRNLTVARDGLA
jgi:hypothetical protein